MQPLKAMIRAAGEEGLGDPGGSCTLCGTPKAQRSIDVHGATLHVWTLTCDCYEEENAEARRDAERARRVLSYDIDRAERLSGFGESARAMTLDTFAARTPEQERVVALIASMPAYRGLAPGDALPSAARGKHVVALYDTPPRDGRRGKTHLLCALYTRWKSEGHYPVYINWSGYLTLRQHLMSDSASVEAYAPLLNAVLNPSYPLVIDDFLKQNVRTPWAAEIAYTLIDGRLRSGASIALAANLDVSDRSVVVNKLSKLGEHDEFAGRVHQRIRENAIGVNVTPWRQFSHAQTMEMLP